MEEVRACLGEVSLDRMARLRSRRVPSEAPYAGAFAGPEMGRLLLPEARSPWIDVALAIAPIAAKAIRFELSNFGISSRERIGPRDNHPTRHLAERVGRALGIEAFELYLVPSWQGAARVFPGDPPALVAPTSFMELPELEQTFALARLFARIAVGFTFLDEIPAEATDGLLLASIRTIDPGFGSGAISPSREHAAQQMLPGVQRAIGRRQRKMLEELASTVAVSYDARAFVLGLRRSEHRIGYLLCGDALAAIDYLRRRRSRHGPLDRGAPPAPSTPGVERAAALRARPRPTPSAAAPAPSGPPFRAARARCGYGPTSTFSVLGVRESTPARRKRRSGPVSCAARAARRGAFRGG